MRGAVAIIGNLNVDLVFYPVNDLPKWGKEKKADLMLTRAAGSAGYSALTLGKLGLAPALIGNVGDDYYGSLIREALGEAGVETRRVEASARRSPTNGATGPL